MPTLVGMIRPETARKMISAGAAGIHIEDQVEAKRCGHRPNKQLVSVEEMTARIKSAVKGKTDPKFIVMARTDAVAGEGMDAAIKRARRYRDAGADMIFAEALSDLDQYSRKFVKAVRVPVLANITEFGKTPLFFPQGTAFSGHRAGVVSPLRLPGHERGGFECLSKRSGRRAPRRNCSAQMQTLAPSSTIF